MLAFKNKSCSSATARSRNARCPSSSALETPAKNITVMDFEDRRGILSPWLKRGVKFERKRVTRENMGALLGKYLSAGDVLIDLAWNIDCCELVQWCHDRGVLYINTSVELWDPYENSKGAPPQKMTLYWRHMNLRKMVGKWAQPGPTAVLEHGANPGLISHFTKQGLIDIGNRSIKDKKITGKAADEIRQLIAELKFNQLAQKLGVKVIHCSERDTQITNRPKEVDEFTNTWSVEGFREKAPRPPRWAGARTKRNCQRAPSSTPTARATKFASRKWESTLGSRRGCRIIAFRAWSCDTARHSRFRPIDGLGNGKAVYRPTVHYAYCPADVAIASLNELRGYNYQLQEKQRILNDEITSGADILGALLMGHGYNSWWVGSDLSIGESRRLVPHQNATTMQVAISVVAAVMWMIENPAKGVCVPDDLPHDYILKISKPYLGKWISKPSDWTPLKHRVDAFNGYNKPDLI